MQPLSSIALLLASVALVSCGADKKASSTASGAPLPLSRRINEKTGFAQDSEGNWKPKVDRRSSFEKQGKSPYFTGQYGKKEFQTGEFAKKAWLGNKSVEKATYQGNTDGGRFAKRSTLGDKSAREADRGAREGRQSANEGGQIYATDPARESGLDPVKTAGDAEANARRKSYPQPAIIDWKQERAMSVQQTKSILGRE